MGPPAEPLGHKALRVIGEKLLAVKRELKHGPFTEWLAREFEWHERTAQRMIAASRRFKSDTVSGLPIEPGALYVLAETRGIPRTSCPRARGAGGGISPRR
jgi:Protein of unknown function (DUF3102)